MKKFLKILLITSIVMVAISAVSLFFLYHNYGKNEEAKKELSLEELDMQLYGVDKEDISEDKVYPLYLSGKKKNVETHSYKKVKEIYNIKNSKNVKKSLEKLKKKNNYTVENCLFAYNPFGTHEHSLYIYFKTQEVTTLRYTVHVEKENIPDFTRTLRLEDSYNQKKEIEGIIAGLVPGEENFIVLNLQNSEGSVVKRMVYSITMPKEEKGIQRQLILRDGNSLSRISNGLYLFLGHDMDNKKMKRAIYMYDNSGVLRGELPICNYQANRVLFLDNQMVYNYSKDSFACISPLGEVKKIYQLNGYQTVNDYTYDGYGNILTIATKKGKGSIEDQIVSLNLETGKTTLLVDMTHLLKKVKKVCKDSSDWIGLNSIAWIGRDSVVLSARELSGIIKVKNISSANPTIDYIIGDKELWKKQGKKKGLLSKYIEENKENDGKTDTFLSQYGQSDVALSSVEEQYPSNESQYYLTMFNNNYNKKRESNSYYYKYYVDELAGMYELVASFEVPFSTYESSVEEYKGNIVVNSGSDCSVGEYDTKGVLIQELKYNVETNTYRIYKEDFKNFWFS